jgi:hypothetical protein
MPVNYGRNSFIKLTLGRRREGEGDSETWVESAPLAVAGRVHHRGDPQLRRGGLDAAGRQPGNSEAGSYSWVGPEPEGRAWAFYLIRPQAPARPLD